MPLWCYIKQTIQIFLFSLVCSFASVYGEHIAYELYSVYATIAIVSVFTFYTYIANRLTSDSVKIHMLWIIPLPYVYFVYVRCVQATPNADTTAKPKNRIKRRRRSTTQKTEATCIVYVCNCSIMFCDKNDFRVDAFGRIVILLEWHIVDVS